MKRFSVSEYHWLIEAGILNKDDKLELLDSVSRVLGHAAPILVAVQDLLP